MSSRWQIAGITCLLGTCLGCVPSQPSPPPEATFPDLPAGARVELVDVAVAWPLPPATGAGEGFLGPLLPCEVLAVFEPLTRTDEPADLCAALVVTAARLDVCVNEGTEACRPELRMVLQPVFDGQARDAALHAFYVVDEEPVLVAIARLMKLRLDGGSDGRGPLGIHPVVASDDAGRAAVADVFADLLATASLDHVTQITVHGDNSAWTFEFRPFIDGEPAAGDARQQHVLSPSATIDVSVNPVSDSEDQFDLLLDDEAAAAASLAEQQAAYDRAARVENPAFHTMGNLDCATCHLAAPARAAALARSPLADSPEAFASSRHDLTPTAVFGDPRFIHAFAWRFTTLTINQRLVNEAANAADAAGARLTELEILK